MEDFFDMDHAKALVYLGASGDNTNKVLLSDDQMCIIYRNNKNVLRLHALHRLKTANKKILLPLILGGIITPFAFLSYFVNLFHPWIHLISVLLGMLLFYLGWNGRSALVVVFRNGDELIHYIPSISKNLSAFISYVNESIATPGAISKTYSIIIECDQEQEHILFGEAEESKTNIFPMMGFTPGQYKRAKLEGQRKQQYAIDPVKSGREIHFEYDPQLREMRPVIDGPIKRSSIIERFPSR